MSALLAFCWAYGVETDYKEVLVSGNRQDPRRQHREKGVVGNVRCAGIRVKGFAFLRMRFSLLSLLLLSFETCNSEELMH